MNIAAFLHDTVEELDKLVANAETPVTAQVELDFLRATAPLLEAKFPGVTPFVTFAESKLQAIITPSVAAPVTKPPTTG